MKIGTIALLLLLTPVAAAQSAKPPAASPVKATPASSTATASGSTALPTTELVNEFLRRMFGHDPAATWTVVAVIPTDAPGVAHIIATAGPQQRPIHLYSLPGGKYAIVGDIIPFGSDPFAPVRSALATQANGAQRGPAQAAVTLVEFSDLQCPFCRSAQPVMDRLVAEVPGTRLVFQPFPLPIHKWAMKAASYAECASQQKPEAFWAFVNGVYEDQANITEQNVDDKLSAIATGAGVDAARVTTCAATSGVSQSIQRSIELGRSVGVNSTPTLFINGRKITGIADVPYDQLKAIVTFEVAEARKQK